MAPVFIMIFNHKDFKMNLLNIDVKILLEPFLSILMSPFGHDV